MRTGMGKDTENAGWHPSLLQGTSELASPVCGFLAWAPPARRNPWIRDRRDPELKILSFFRTEVYVEGSKNPGSPNSGHTAVHQF